MPTPGHSLRANTKRLVHKYTVSSGVMFDFRRITLFCLEKRLSRHKMTIFSKILGGYGPSSPPGYAYESKYCFFFKHNQKKTATRLFSFSKTDSVGTKLYHASHISNNNVASLHQVNVGSCSRQYANFLQISQVKNKDKNESGSQENVYCFVIIANSVIMA